MVEYRNLWESVGNLCLKNANDLLKLSQTPTVETAEAVNKLVESAVLIDLLNLYWENRNQSAVEALQGRFFPWLKEEN